MNLPFYTPILSCLQPDIDAAVKLLLDLKARYKTTTGKDWKPGQAPVQSKKGKAAEKSQDELPPAAPADVSQLYAEITDQGNKVRDLKSAKASKVIASF